MSSSAIKSSLEKRVYISPAPSHMDLPKGMKLNSAKTSLTSQTLRKIDLIMDISFIALGILCMAQGIGIVSKPVPIPFSNAVFYLPGAQGVLFGAAAIGVTLMKQAINKV